MQSVEVEAYAKKQSQGNPKKQIEEGFLVTYFMLIPIPATHVQKETSKNHEEKDSVEPPDALYRKKLRMIGGGDHWEAASSSNESFGSRLTSSLSMR